MYDNKYLFLGKVYILAEKWVEKVQELLKSRGENV